MAKYGQAQYGTTMRFFVILSIFIISPTNGRSFIKREQTYTIYVDGVIYTVDGDDWDLNPAEAMVVDDSTSMIRYVGKKDVALNYATEYSKVVYLEGKVVFPGFHDVHMHPLEARSVFGKDCLVLGNTPPEDMVNEIARCNPNDGGSSWVLGHGHSIEAILEHIGNYGRPPKDIIDEVIPLNPVVIMEETSHSVWVNSKALELAGISKNTQNNPGGIIMKDQESGEPNGILFENAGNEIMDIATSSFQNLDEINYEGLLIGLEELRKNGITSVCDARSYWKRRHQQAWKWACDDNELTVRAVLGLWAYPAMDDAKQIQALKSLYVDNYNENICSLRLNEIKVYSDGLLESTTAAMLNPYVKNLHLPNLTENIGMNYFTQSRLATYLSELQNFGFNKGFDFHIHAIGDRGVEEVLNAVQQSKTNFNRRPRHRMTHLEQIDPRDYGRFAELDVIADFQITGNFTLPKERYRIENVVGYNRAKNFIPVKSIADTGAVVTLSSDWDVSDLNPFISIQHASQRGDQSVSTKLAVEMHTINGAFAMRQENKVGSLKRGMEADFIIVDKDPIKVPNNEIGLTKVLATVFKGNLIYQQDKNYPKYNEYF